MSNRSRAFLLGLGFAGLSLLASPSPTAAQQPKPSLARSSSDRLTRRTELFAKQRMRPLDHVPEGAEARARDRWSEIVLAPARGAGDVRERPHPPEPSPGPKDSMWTMIGPAPLDVSLSPTSTPNMGPTAGRASALVIDPTNSNTLYAGYSLGGVWKSLDGGKSWKPIFEGQPTQAIGALAIDPASPNTIYAGTGEPALYAGYGGKGVWKSVDAGATWMLVGGAQFDGLAISRIVIDGKDLYLTSVFSVQGRGEYCTNVDAKAKGQGLFKSSDGGATWKLLKAGSLVDLEVVTSVTPRRIFISSVSAGVSLSEDGGATWSSPAGLPAGADRPEVTVSTKNPNIVYVGAGVSSAAKMFVSQDAGKTFTELPGSPNYCTEQCSWDNSVAIDPNDDNTVYVGGSLCGVWSTQNGLSATPTWTDLSAPNNDCGAQLENWYLGVVHPDVHNLAFDPKDSSIVYAVTDGGIARTKDKGATWERLNDGVGTIQFYGLCVDPTNVDNVFGGGQDNGSFRTSPTKKSLVWDGITSGDGGPCVVDPANPGTVLMSNEEGTLFLSKTAFKNLVAATTVFDASPYCQKGVDPGCGDRSLFIPPIAVDTVRGGSFFYGTYRVWRNDAGGVKKSWKAASPDLTRGPASVPCGNAMDDDKLSAIIVAPSDPKVIATGSEGGMIQLTTDGGASWKVISKAPLPDRWVSAVAIDPNDPKTIFAAFSGFSAGTPSTPGHVFVTRDQGATWKLADVPVDTPVDAMVAHPAISGLVYAGTDLGVLVSKDAGASWDVLGSNLPTVPVYSMAFHSAASTLFVGTHGRSAWTTAFKAGALSAAPTMLTFTAVEGGADPAAQTVTIAESEVLGSVVPWTSKISDPWITGVDPAGKAGGAGQVESVKVAIAGLAVGEYDGKITITPMAGAPVDVAVHLSITAMQMTTTGTGGASTTPPPAEDKGCGCRVGDQDSDSSYAALGAVGLAAIFVARRRRRVT